MTPRPVGLIFHGIGTPGRPVDSGEALYWVSTTLFETILDRIRTLPRPDLIRLSFDDGNLSDHDIALPRLLERGLAADFFVLSGRIGQPGSLDAGHIRALQAAGMGIGSHGVAHRDWRGLNKADLSTELSQSQAELEAIIDRPVTAAGIPFGGYNARVLRALHRAGYACAYSSDCGPMNPTAFLRPRASVRAAMTAAELAALLAGRMSGRQRLRRAVSMTARRIL